MRTAAPPRAGQRGNPRRERRGAVRGGQLADALELGVGGKGKAGVHERREVVGHAGAARSICSSRPCTASPISVAASAGSPSRRSGASVASPRPARRRSGTNSARRAPARCRRDAVSGRAAARGRLELGQRRHLDRAGRPRRPRTATAGLPRLAGSRAATRALLGTEAVDAQDEPRVVADELERGVARALELVRGSSRSSTQPIGVSASTRGSRIDRAGRRSAGRSPASSRRSRGGGARLARPRASASFTSS